MKKRPDIPLLLVTLILSVIGLIMVYSTTTTQRGGYSIYYFKKYILIWVLSLFILFLIARIKIQWLYRASYPLLGISILLLVLIFIPPLGINVKGATRWLNLLFFQFQPSEFAKLSFMVFLSRHLALTADRRDSLKTLYLPLGLMLLIQGLLLLQPDFGAAIMLGLLTISMLFIAGTPLRFLLLLTLLLLPPTAILLHQPYRLKRLMAFLNPWEDPSRTGFQLIQSLIALGRGGISGVGLGNSHQKLNFLPEANTDFIFSILGEEIGLVGVTIVIGLYIVFFHRSMRIALNQEGLFRRYLATSMGLMITLQCLVNLGVVTGLLPTKGLPMPFISRGGTSLLVNMAAVAILLRLGIEDSEPLAERTDKSNLRVKLTRRYKSLRPWVPGGFLK